MQTDMKNMLFVTFFADFLVDRLRGTLWGELERAIST